MTEMESVEVRAEILIVHRSVETPSKGAAVHFQSQKKWGFGQSFFKAGLGLFVATLLGFGIPGTAFGDYIVIDSVLGTQARFVTGIETMSQQEIAYQGVLLALSPEGWNLEAFGGIAVENGPPLWDGGVEWSLLNIPAEDSEDWGYELNQEAQEAGNVRHLMFHTDDTISRLSHDICEPSPFGVISGYMGGEYAQCGIANWGEFYVAEEDPVSRESTTWGHVKTRYR